MTGEMMMKDRLCLMTAGALGAILLTGDRTHADDYQVISFGAQVSASASAYDSNDSDGETNADETDSIGDLPLAVTASASTFKASGSGNGRVAGSIVHSEFELSASGSGGGFGSGFDSEGSGGGSAEFTMTFSVERTLRARIELVAIGDGSGNIGNGYASFTSDGTLVESADSDNDFYDEVVFDYTLKPGTVYEVTGYGAGGGDSGFGGGSDAYGDGVVSITTLCAIDGTLSMGENAFDTAGAQGSDCDLTDLCDPGDFGDDVIYAARYFHFTPEESTQYTFSTCNSASFDTRLAILADDCDPSSVIDCLDDSVGCSGFTTSLARMLEAGTRYTIVVGGYNANSFGSGVLDVTALPIAFTVVDLGADLEALADAQFFGCNGQPPQSDSEQEVANPTTMDELPVSVQANAGTCCSNGFGSADLEGTAGLNTFSASAESIGGSCASGDSCVSASGSGFVDATFVLDVVSYSEADIGWGLFGDFGGSAGMTLRDPDGTVILNEIHGIPFNQGSTTLTLIPGVYRIELSTAASAGGDCTVPDPYAVADVEVAMQVLAVEPGDVNADGSIDGTDLALVLGSWGACAGCPEDLNEDGVVDGIDLAFVLGGWTG